ncbi:MAG: glycosyltransferase family 39 protein [Planctomycetaceae bacterium]
MRLQQYVTPMTLAAVAFLLAASRINHGLVDSSLPAGPGVTLDEPINVSHGIYLFDALLQHGPLLLTPSAAQDVFGDEQYMADYPPLGRLCLGAAHEATAWLISGAEASPLNIPAARLASCMAFAATVLLLTEFARRRYGVGTAVAAAVFLMLMPRVVGHARLASLETLTSLAWLAALVPILAWWTADKPPTTRQAAVSGLFLGLLLLTKIQAILFPPMLCIWALWRYRTRAIRPVVLWGIVGGAVFFVGWPWLWLAPWENTLAYFVQASKRLTLYTWYFGHRFTDKAVPWHFSFVMTAVTVPLAVFVPIGWRVLTRRPEFDRDDLLLSLSVVWPMIVFAIPGTPVYDGTRLYLVIMPPLSLLAGRSIVRTVQVLQTSLKRTTSDANPLVTRTGAGLAAACLLLIAADLVLATPVPGPCAVDFYNVAGRAIQSASPTSPPLEAGYWADALNGNFWNQVPENSTVMVAPVSHQFQLPDWEQCVPVVRQRNIRLVPFTYDVNQRGLLLLVHRLADLRPSLRSVPDGAEVLAEVTSNGTVLARLIDTTSASWTEVADWPKDMQ